MRYKRKRDKCFWTMARSYLHDYMPAIRNLSDKTIETYKQSLKTYLRFLKEKKNIEDELVSFEAFTRDYVKEFIIWLKGQGASTRTINLRITSIRSFLKYCGQEDFELRGIYESVCQIQKLKEEKHPILYLQPEATAAILSAYDMNTQKHRRNRMILILLYDTGARVQELADLDIESLHLDVPNPYISIIGKGRKRRNVPIMRKTVAHLNSYLKEFHPSEQSAPLFYILPQQSWFRSTHRHNSNRRSVCCALCSIALAGFSVFGCCQILRHCRHLDSTGNRLHLFPVPSDVLLFVCLGHTIPILRRNSHIQTH